MQDREVGVPVPETQPRHPLAHPEPGHFLPYGGHLARDLAAQRDGLGGLGDLADDGQGDPDRLGTDQEFTRARRGDGGLLQEQRAAGGLVPDATHRTSRDRWEAQ